MTRDLTLIPRDLASRAERDRWRAVWSRIWPEFAESDEELLLEAAHAGAMRAWVISDGERDIGLLQVERTRWNGDQAPPIVYLLLDDDEQGPDRFAWLLAPCADFAREHGFDELRIYCWERESLLVDFATSWPGWQITERDIDVELDLRRPPTEAERRPVPPGVEIVSFAERPDLKRDAWAALVAALPDVPGDEPQAIPTFEKWTESHSGPQHRDDARFVALLDGRVVGLGELELPAIAARDGRAWHGFTAVHPDARGRGVALALKQRTIAWARDAGLSTLRTENEARNAPMRHINALFGYQPVPARVVIRGPLASLPTSNAPVAQQKG
ncbi:MAG: hypothetical protein JWN41_1258 [Thermoleophilia bacterium]|nr:hypothetical protein [Thermoleophilia bacterium]